MQVSRNIKYLGNRPEIPDIPDRYAIPEKDGRLYEAALDLCIAFVGIAFGRSPNSVSNTKMGQNEPNTARTKTMTHNIAIFASCMEVGKDGKDRMFTIE